MLDTLLIGVNLDAFFEICSDVHDAFDPLRSIKNRQ